MLFPYVPAIYCFQEINDKSQAFITNTDKCHAEDTCCFLREFCDTLYESSGSYLSVNVILLTFEGWTFVIGYLGTDKLFNHTFIYLINLFTCFHNGQKAKYKMNMSKDGNKHTHTHKGKRQNSGTNTVKIK